MIALEIRNDEVRAIKTTAHPFKKEIEDAHSEKIDERIIDNLIDGEVEGFVEFLERFLSNLTFSYKDQSYSITLNLRGTMTQKIAIPKVKKKEIPMVLRSVLVSEGVSIEDNAEITYSILKDKDKNHHNMYSHIFGQKVSHGIVKAFNKMNLKIRYIDVSPNTVMKAFAKSEFSDKEEYPLQLVVDLSLGGIKYYQFEDKELRLNYLEASNFENIENYLQYFEENVELFKDEYNEYNYEDMEVILMGEREVIDVIFEEYVEKFNLSIFSEGIPFIDNYSFKKFDKYIDTVGSMLRNDKVLSSDSKYDINMLDRKDVDLEPNYNNLIKGGLIVVGLVAIVGTLFLGTIVLESGRLKKDNDILTLYLNDVEIKEQFNISVDLDRNISVFDRALGEMISVEEYFSKAKKLYTEEALVEIYKSLPDNVIIDGGLVLRDGFATFTIRTKSEADFLNYASSLTKRDDLFSKIEYSSYTGTKQDSYTGEFIVEMAGDNNE